MLPVRYELKLYVQCRLFHSQKELAKCESKCSGEKPCSRKRPDVDEVIYVLMGTGAHTHTHTHTHTYTHTHTHTHTHAHVTVGCACPKLIRRYFKRWLFCMSHTPYVSHLSHDILYVTYSICVTPVTWYFYSYQQGLLPKRRSDRDRKQSFDWSECPSAWPPESPVLEQWQLSTELYVYFWHWPHLIFVDTNCLDVFRCNYTTPHKVPEAPVTFFR